MHKFFIRCVAFGTFAFVLAGCIVVDDFGEYWNKGFIDNCVNEIVTKGYDYDRPTYSDAKPLLLRSLRVGSHTLLMMRDDLRDKGGDLMLYKIEDGFYISYRLNESKRENFVRDYPDSAVVITSETATIPLLNNDSLNMLSSVADDDGYWVESHREAYNPENRSDCIQTLY